MPVTRGAIKKLRQDSKREARNSAFKSSLKKTLRDYKDHPSPKKLGEVYSALDNAKKKKIFHPNKVDRIKGRLSKHLISRKTSKSK